VPKKDGSTIGLVFGFNIAKKQKRNEEKYQKKKAASQLW